MREKDTPRIGTSAAPDQSRSSEGPRLPFCGDLAMRIGRDGTWYYQGSPIGRPAMVKLFASVLRREADGHYWLVTPFERGRIVVDDAPFVAVEAERLGEGRAQSLRFRTNLDEWVTLDGDHPLRMAEGTQAGEPRPYVLIRPGLEALIARSVFYHLVEWAVPDESGEQLGLWSAGRFYALGSLP